MKDEKQGYIEVDISDELKRLDEMLYGIRDRELSAFKEFLINLGATKEDVKFIGHDSKLVIHDNFNVVDIPIQLRNRVVISRYVDLGSIMIYYGGVRYDPSKANTERPMFSPFRNIIKTEQQA
jgi:hypothetical protein